MPSTRAFGHRRVTDNLAVHDGLVVIRARHAGNGNFIVGLNVPAPGVPITERYEDGYSVFNGPHLF